jgi:hypothetical protein
VSPKPGVDVSEETKLLSSAGYRTKISRSPTPLRSHYNEYGISQVLAYFSIPVLLFDSSDSRRFPACTRLVGFLEQQKDL